MENVPKVRRNSEDALYNNWCHAYSIDAMVHLLHRHAKDPERCKRYPALIEQQIDMLRALRVYLRRLVLLRRFRLPDAAAQRFDDQFRDRHGPGRVRRGPQGGNRVPQKIVDRGMASILRQRKPDFSYDYGEYLKYMPMLPINRPGGSLGRSQACNLAMRLWGDKQVTDAVMETWLDRLFARELWLDLGRKRPIPHESWFQVAGYFFYYGHYYAARCIEILPPAQRPDRQDHLAQVLAALAAAGRHLVGFSFLQLPPGVWDGICADEPGKVQAEVTPLFQEDCRGPFQETRAGGGCSGSRQDGERDARSRRVVYSYTVASSELGV